MEGLPYEKVWDSGAYSDFQMSRTSIWAWHELYLISRYQRLYFKTDMTVLFVISSTSTLTETLTGKNGGVSS